MRMFEAKSEASFRYRLREFIEGMLANPFARDMQIDASELTDKTMALAEQFELIQQDHIAELAVILVTIMCAKSSPGQQRAVFNILANTQECPDQRIFDSAYELGISGRMKSSEDE